MEPRETIAYTPIDFVGTDERAKEFNNVLTPSLVQAQQKIEREKYPIHLGLKTTVISEDRHGWGISEEGRTSFNQGLAKLTQAGIDYYVDTWPSGPTRSMYGVLFDQGLLARGFQAIVTGDLDQFQPHQNLERVLTLCEHIKGDNSLLGVGARNIPVVLSANPENAYLRRIFEGVMNLTVRNASRSTNHYIQGELAPKGFTDRAYEMHGDLITGVYMFNPEHPNAQTFQKQVVETARERNFFGFEDEYFMAFCAATMGNISSIYFNCEPNLFSPEDDPEKEKERIINKQIQAPLTKLIGVPFMEWFLRDSIEHKNKEFLEEFYTHEQVYEVKEAMRQPFLLHDTATNKDR
ncbi:hypothetical protein HYT51_00825 [Candidatus Woesearchaeota archaeon]|nr:hypothetical protein [Candidatus Woesearchaeota archaeon]